MIDIANDRYNSYMIAYDRYKLFCSVPNGKS